MSAFERAAIERLIKQADAAGINVPDHVRAAAASCGTANGGAILHAEQYPNAENIGCCYGSADGGLEACTCWRPEYDVDQAPVSLDTVLEHRIETRAARCGDCAYRPDSPERAEVFTAEQLIHLAATGEPFWCHDGMRKPDRWRHPQRTEVVIGSGDDWQPPIAVGIPWRADGRPALLCAGWASEGRRQERLNRTGPCCDLHGRTCEPPSELCCHRCTEGAHPTHADGSVCSAPDLSGTG